MTSASGLSSAAGPLAARRFDRALAAKASDLVPLLDFACVLLTGYLSLAAAAVLSDAPPGGWDELYRLAWIASAVAPFMLYDPRFAVLAAGDHGTLLRAYAGRCLMLLGVIGTIAFAGRWLEPAPALWLVLWPVCAVLLGGAGRLLFARYLRRLDRRGALAETVAVMGAGPLADQLIPRLRGNATLFGVFDDRSGRSDAQLHPPEATLEGLVLRARGGKPDRILVALPALTGQRLAAIVDRLRPLGVPVELCPPSLGRSHPALAIGHVGEWLPVTVLADRPIKRWNAVLKSAEDGVLAVLIVVLLLPVLAGIALAIRLESRGPILFRQRRHGFNNRQFDIYKFRTMRYEPAAPDSALQQTVRGDSRVTRVGRVLRKWSLDELPQVFNVLEGDMSLVGPRPHAVNMRTEQRLGHEIVAAYSHRHRVKPGITGWAQINGSRGATDTAEQLRRRVELDLYYVENWSLLLDLKILCLTSREVLRATNAF